MEKQNQNELYEQHKDFIRQLNKPNIPNSKEIIEKYDIYQVDHKGKTILHLCAIENYKDLILYIFESFSDKSKKAEFINKKDNKGWSAIYYAIDISENGFPDIVELLLKNGADPNQADDKGITALHLTAYKGQDDNVEILLKYKADPNKKDIIGRVALNYGIMEGQTNSVQALLDNNTDLSTVDINKDSLLHYATIGKGNGLLYVIMLCDRGINVNAVNKFGDTCLNLCVKNGARENIRIIQKILFDFKADPNIYNNNRENFYSLMAKEAINEKINLEDKNLNDEFNNLFFNTKAFTSNAKQIVANDNQDNKNPYIKAQFSNYLYFYIFSVIIIIISNIAMKYK